MKENKAKVYLFLNESEKAKLKEEAKKINATMTTVIQLALRDYFKKEH